MNKKSLVIIGVEIIALVILYGFITSQYLEMIPSCWIHRETGLLCPACGGTRCLISLLKGNWIKAFFSHTIFFIGILYLFIINVVYIINLNREKKIATWMYPKYWYVFVFTILLIIYTIIRNLL